MPDYVVYSELWKAEIAEYEKAKAILKETETELRQKIAPVLMKAEADRDIMTIRDMIAGLPKDFWPARFLFEAEERVSAIIDEAERTGT